MAGVSSIPPFAIARPRPISGRNTLAIRMSLNTCCRHSFLTCFTFMVSGFDLEFFYAVSALETAVRALAVHAVCSRRDPCGAEQNADRGDHTPHRFHLLHVRFCIGVNHVKHVRMSC